MTQPRFTALVLLTLSVAISGCSVARFTPTGAPARSAQRAPFDVHVFAAGEAFASYREVGVLEVSAQGFAEAQLRMQEIGGAYGCHAVRLVTTVTHVVAARRAPVSQTTYLGSCLVPGHR